MSPRCAINNAKVHRVVFCRLDLSLVAGFEPCNYEVEDFNVPGLKCNT